MQITNPLRQIKNQRYILDASALQISRFQLARPVKLFNSPNGLRPAIARSSGRPARRVGRRDFFATKITRYSS